MDIKPLTPEGLKQSPNKKVDKKLDKVEVGRAPVIDDSVNLWDAIRLFFGKKIENGAFTEFEISKGKVAAVAVGGVGGIGFLVDVNWALLLTGSPIEIIKVVIGVIGLAMAWLWKK